MTAFISRLAGLPMALTMLVLSSAASSPTPDTCRGSGTWLENEGQQNEEIHLSCAGQCSGTKDCKERTGTDAQGSFIFCGCDSSDYDTCCTVVLRDDGEGNLTVPDTYGDCPACQLAGTCFLSGSDNQPSCGTPPSGH